MRVVSQQATIRAGQNGRATYENGERPRVEAPAAKDPDPQDKLIAGLTTAMANAMERSAVTIASACATLLNDKPDQLEEWEFKVGRDLAGRLVSIKAKRIS